MSLVTNIPHFLRNLSLTILDAKKVITRIKDAFETKHPTILQMGLVSEGIQKM